MLACETGAVRSEDGELVGQEIRAGIDIMCLEPCLSTSGIHVRFCRSYRGSDSPGYMQGTSAECSQTGFMDMPANL